MFRINVDLKKKKTQYKILRIINQFLLSFFMPTTQSLNSLSKA
jgi:hypothetical protein